MNIIKLKSNEIKNKIIENFNFKYSLNHLMRLSKGYHLVLMEIHQINNGVKNTKQNAKI